MRKDHGWKPRSGHGDVAGVMALVRSAQHHGHLRLFEQRRQTTIMTFPQRIYQKNYDAWYGHQAVWWQFGERTEAEKSHHRDCSPRLQSRHPLLSIYLSRESQLLQLHFDLKVITMASSQETRVVNIGTRRSQLAIAQVDMVVKHLQTFAPGPEYKSQVVSTMADENQVKSFQEFNAKSIWTEELEKLLMEKKLDVIVHCLKGRSNIPTDSAETVQL
jgi:hypothetical protein